MDCMRSFPSTSALNLVFFLYLATLSLYSCASFASVSSLVLPTSLSYPNESIALSASSEDGTVFAVATVHGVYVYAFDGKSVKFLKSTESANPVTAIVFEGIACNGANSLMIARNVNGKGQISLLKMSGSSDLIVCQTLASVVFGMQFTATCKYLAAISSDCVRLITVSSLSTAQNFYLYFKSLTDQIQTAYFSNDDTYFLISVAGAAYDCTVKSPPTTCGTSMGKLWEGNLGCWSKQNVNPSLVSNSQAICKLVGGNFSSFVSSNISSALYWSSNWLLTNLTSCSVIGYSYSGILGHPVKTQTSTCGNIAGNVAHTLALITSADAALYLISLEVGGSFSQLQNIQGTVQSAFFIENSVFGTSNLFAVTNYRTIAFYSNVTFSYSIVCATPQTVYDMSETVTFVCILPYPFANLPASASILSLYSVNQSAAVLSWKQLQSGSTPSYSCNPQHQYLKGISMPLFFCSSLRSSTAYLNTTVLGVTLHLYVPASYLAAGTYYISTLSTFTILNTLTFATVNVTSVYINVTDSSQYFAVGDATFLSPASTITNSNLYPSTETILWTYSSGVLESVSTLALDSYVAGIQLAISVVSLPAGVVPLVIISTTAVYSLNFTSGTFFNSTFSPSSLFVNFEDRYVFFPSQNSDVSVVGFCNVTAYNSTLILCTLPASLASGSLFSVRVYPSYSTQGLIANNFVTSSIESVFSGWSSLNLFASQYVSSTLISFPLNTFQNGSLSNFLQHTVPSNFNLSNPTNLDYASSLTSSNGYFTNVFGSQVKSEPLYSAGNFFIGDFLLYLVNYVAPQGNLTLMSLTCTISYFSSTGLVCNTDSLPSTISYASYLNLALFTMNTITVSADTYSYPTQPVIFSVSGCSSDVISVYATANCPTSVFTNLTISGTGFVGGLIAKVGSSSCIVQKIVSNQIVCLLPPGTGVFLSVILSSSGTTSTTVNNVYVSYSMPTIASISGCSASSLTSGPSNCSRTGGDIITIRGSGLSFSSRVITVYVGSGLCSVLNHSDSFIFCVLPVGRFKNVPVLILLDTGVNVVSSININYAACEAGYQEDPASNFIGCIPCQPGFYNDAAAVTTCQECRVGTFNSLSAASSCFLCESGSYVPLAMNSTVCLPCPAGKFSVSQSVACTACFSNTISNASSSSCVSCASNSVPDASSTLCVCISGFFMTENGVCLDCPAGGDCSQVGTNYSSIAPKIGYWKNSASAIPVFNLCPLGEACPGSLSSSCAAGYTGILCAVCDTNYYFSGTSCLGISFFLVHF